jgi:hypothetical protein
MKIGNFEWNFPGLRKIRAKLKEVYNKHGLVLTILYVLFGVIVLKFGIINGILWIIDLLFGTNLFPGPITHWLLTNLGFYEMMSWISHCMGQC